MSPGLVAEDVKDIEAERPNKENDAIERIEADHPLVSSVFEDD